MRYVFYKDHTLLRKSTKLRMGKKMKILLMYCENGYTMGYSDWLSINSYGGWILHCDGKIYIIHT
jgi:RNA-directed DNA polymerase